MARRTGRQSNLFDDLGSGFNDFESPLQPTHNRVSSTGISSTMNANDDLSFFNSDFQELEMPSSPTSRIQDTSSLPYPQESNLFSNTGYNGPSVTNFFGNQFATDFVLGMGLEQVNKMQSNTASKYWAFFENMKIYFNVNNSYVLNKLLLVLLPFRKNKWSSVNGPPNINMPGPQSPNEPRDLNAPDLYIPLMFFTTYILLVCALLGTKSKFTPEYLTSLASTGLILTFLEVVLVKLGFYLLSVPSNISILDATAYSGYKYIGVVISILAGALIGYWAYLPICICTSLMMALFLLKTLRRACVNQNDMRLQMDQMSKQRNFFIIAIALLQIPIFLLLTYRYSRDEYSILNWLLGYMAKPTPIPNIPKIVTSLAPEPIVPVDQPLM